MRATPWSRSRRSRSPLGAVATLVAIAAIALLAAWLQPPSPTLSGRAEAVDGDTLRIGGTRVRFTGLDAVELDQICTNDKREAWDCGYAAHAFLAAAVKGRTTECKPDGRDRYGRVLAKCDAGAGDLGAAVVKAGWAVADVEYGLALVQARTGRHGIWSGAFDDPAEWRRKHGGETFDLWAWLMGWLGR